MNLPSYEIDDSNIDRFGNQNNTDVSIMIRMLNAKLPLIASSLDSYNKSVGADFMEIGKKLLSTHQSITELINKSIRIQSIIRPTDDNNGISLDTVVKSSSYTVENILNQQNILNDDLPRMSEITEQITLLIDEGNALSWVAKRLGILKLYFRVESSRNEEIDREYSDFQTQMGELVDTITSLRQVMQTDAEKACDMHRQTEENLQSELNRLIQYGDISEKNLEYATNEVLRLTNQSHEASVSFTECLQRIITHVGQVVISIQFHDIVRQQIEHIIEAFQQLLSRSNETDDGLLVYCYQILKVQIAQLAQVIKTVNNAHTNISNSFAAINNEVGFLMDIISRRGSCNSDKEMNSSLKNLTSVINELKSVQQYTQDLIQNVQQNEAAVIQMATRLNNHIDDMSVVNDEVKLNAINAIINSSRLGADGETLAVLADQMMQLAIRSDEIMENTVLIIGNINFLANKRNLTEESLNLNMHSESNPSDFSELINEIENLYNRFNVECSCVLSQAESVRQLLPKIQKQSAFITVFSSNLKVQMHLLSELEQQLTPYFSGISLDGINFKEMDLSRYTMSSERDVHLEIMSSTDVNSINGTCPTNFIQPLHANIPDDNDTNTDNDDELGDNIELF